VALPYRFTPPPDSSDAPARHAPDLIGLVRDAKSGAPIPGIAVLALGSRAGDLTDAQGRYAITGLPRGSAIFAGATGWRSQWRWAVAGGARARMDFRLERCDTCVFRCPFVERPGGAGGGGP